LFCHVKLQRNDELLLVFSTIVTSCERNGNCVFVCFRRRCHLDYEGAREISVAISRELGVCQQPTNEIV